MNNNHRGLTAEKIMFDTQESRAIEREQSDQEKAILKRERDHELSLQYLDQLYNYQFIKTYEKWSKENGLKNALEHIKALEKASISEYWHARKLAMDEDTIQYIDKLRTLLTTPVADFRINVIPFGKMRNDLDRVNELMLKSAQASREAYYKRNS